jgi:hypothetical protein
VFAACHLATDSTDVARFLAENAKVGTRTATAKHLKMLAGHTETEAALVSQLLNHNDLQVQRAGGYDGPADGSATVWTCSSCWKENDIAVEDCAHCTHGVRP